MPWTTLIALLALALPSGAAQKPDPRDRTAHVALLRVSAWPELVARDRSASFGLRTGPGALLDLGRADITEARRAAALIALGCGRVVAERERVAGFANEGRSAARAAALWALGAYRSPNDVEALIEFAGRRALVADEALFALALNGTPAALAHLRAVAASSADPHQAAAAEALSFLDDPPAESARARAYFELRFEAARRYGLVEGEAWEVLLIDDLVHDAKFVNRVVYRGASELRRPGVRDHFLEAVLAGGASERLRGAVAALPTELSQLIADELYAPADDKEWDALLSEIERRDLAPLTEPILRRAWVMPGARAQASALLAWAGAPGAVQLLDVNLRSTEAAERAFAAEALGKLGDAGFLSALSALVDDEDALVRAAALVARARLGDTDALKALEQRLGLEGEAAPAREPGPDDAALRRALTRAAADVRVRPVLRALLERGPEAWKTDIAGALLWGGCDDVRDLLRERLKRERPTGAGGARAVAALGRRPSLADLVLLRDLFPLGDDLEVDAELACALLRARDAEVLTVLRAALWTEPWNRSVLAGALWIEVAGIDSLRVESSRPPLGSSARDLRRVGFALGEWGGSDEVERLAARVGSADPVLQGAVLGALGARTH